MIPCSQYKSLLTADSISKLCIFQSWLLSCEFTSSHEHFPGTAQLPNQPAMSRIEYIILQKSVCTYTYICPVITSFWRQLSTGDTQTVLALGIFGTRMKQPCESIPALAWMMQRVWQELEPYFLFAFLWATVLPACSPVLLASSSPCRKCSQHEFSTCLAQSRGRSVMEGGLAGGSGGVPESSRALTSLLHKAADGSMAPLLWPWGLLSATDQHQLAYTRCLHTRPPHCTPAGCCPVGTLGCRTLWPGQPLGPQGSICNASAFRELASASVVLLLCIPGHRNVERQLLSLSF